MFVGGVAVVIFVAAFQSITLLSNLQMESIYIGAVVLIDSVIACKVGWYSFGNSFSVDDALKQVIAEIQITPFYCDENKY